MYFLLYYRSRDLIHCSVVKWMLSTCKALGSIPGNKNKRRKRKEGKEEEGRMGEREGGRGEAIKERQSDGSASKMFVVQIR